MHTFSTSALEKIYIWQANINDRRIHSYSAYITGDGSQPRVNPRSFFIFLRVAQR